MKHAIRIAGLGLLTGAAVTLAATGIASAHGRMGPMGGGFEPGGRGEMALDFNTLDADGNGQITEEDLAARATARFGEADADANGTLDATELAAQVVAQMEARIGDGGKAPRRGDPETMAERMVERMIGARDADEDGVLSAAELEPKNGFSRMIDRFDTDDDNAISEAEFDEATADRAARFEDRDGRRGGKDGRDGGKRR